jgi:hypothetical protein
MTPRGLRVHRNPRLGLNPSCLFPMSSYCVCLRSLLPLFTVCSALKWHVVLYHEVLHQINDLHMFSRCCYYAYCMLPPPENLAQTITCMFVFARRTVRIPEHGLQWLVACVVFRSSCSKDSVSSSRLDATASFHILAISLISKLFDGVWYEIPPIPGHWGFNDNGIIIQNGEVQEKTYDLTMYGSLPAGTYRFVAFGLSIESSI